MAKRQIQRLRSGKPYGKPFPADEKLANALVKQGTHGYVEDEPAFVPTYQTRAEPKPARAEEPKRRYRRRDLKAEGE